MPLKLVTSRENPLFKSLRKLAQSPRERRKAGKALLDGIHLLADYAARIGPPEMLVVSSSGQDKPEIRAMLAQFSELSAIVLVDGLFDEIAPVDSPSGILGVVEVAQLPIPTPIGFAVFIEAVQDPGNLGSILRSAAAAGVEVAYLSSGCADAWSPRVLRGGMGAQFALPVREGADLISLARDFAGDVVVTSLQAQDSLFDIDLTGPVALVVGNEGAGVSRGLQEAATQLVRIPMPRALESLNVAAAAAICLFERVRQMGASTRLEVPLRDQGSLAGK
jgi:RNA methyltransferase, TrmH family